MGMSPQAYLRQQHPAATSLSNNELRRRSKQTGRRIFTSSAGDILGVPLSVLMVIMTFSAWSPAVMIGNRSIRTAASAFHIPVTPHQQRNSFNTRSFRYSPSSHRSTATTSTSRFYSLVIVESPAKCKTIEKILNQQLPEAKSRIKTKNETTKSSTATEGGDSNQQGNNKSEVFKVLSCYGHIRDLPKKIVKSSSNDATTASDTFPYKVAGIDLSQGQYTPRYEIIPRQNKRVIELQQAADQAEAVYLATDPDREGEAMAWHLQETIFGSNRQTPQKEEPSDGRKPLYRIRFSEITPAALHEAMDATKDTNVAGETTNNEATTIAMDLVNAQETRRIVDRLAGFTVSPVLWKKIAPGLSAGRVQSVGLWMLVERERARLLHVPQAYFTVQAELIDRDKKNTSLVANLHSINSQRIVKTSADLQQKADSNLGNAEGNSKMQALLHLDAPEIANHWVDSFSPTVTNVTYHVSHLQHTTRTRQPPPPYKTSTLQQDAVRRLGSSVQVCMMAAQKLYEAGYISYIRTDSTVLSETAQEAIQTTLKRQYGAGEQQQDDDKQNPDAVYYVNRTASSKASKAKHAQEAHEAIRPAIFEDDRMRTPDELPPDIEDGMRELYTMVYQRTLAYAMPELVTNQTTVTILADNGTDTMEFKVTGSVVLQPGYTQLYPETEESRKSHLPDYLYEGQPLELKNITSVRHETQPPPRFTEASFVKELEALGVGRPSTYARIVSVLRERAYVRSSRPPRNPKGGAISAFRAAGGEQQIAKSAASLVPTLSAFVVCNLLEEYCPNYVDPTFTARMEDRLDLIAGGDDQRVQYLDDFYAGPDGLAARVQRIEQEADADRARRVILPPRLPEDTDVALCIGPWGPFVKKNNETAPMPMEIAPDLEHLNVSTLELALQLKRGDNSILGRHPKDGRNILLKTGRFGAYLQWGDDDDGKKSTHGLPRDKAIFPATTVSGENEDCITKDTQFLFDITLEEAIGYVSLPRTVCTFNGLPIETGISRYGPFLKYNETYVSLSSEMGDVLSITAETAEPIVKEEIIDNPKKRPRGVVAELGHMEGSPVTIKLGRFGKYINWKRVNGKIPSEYADNPAAIPLETAWTIIQDKADSPASTRKGTRQSQDPNVPPKPKRPLSAYFHFCAEKRPEVSRSTKKLGDISKRLSALWAETPSSSRSKYEELARQGQEEYKAQLKQWKKDNKTPSGSSDISSNKPKRPRSAYIFFCSEKRPEVQKHSTKLGDVAKELARQWAETTDRTLYQKLADEDKVRYQRELSTSGAAPSTSGRYPPQRPKRPKSAYLFFCAEQRPAVAKKISKLGDISKELARLWAETDDRHVYEEKAEQDKERYRLELNGITADDVSHVSQNGTDSRVNSPSMVVDTPDKPRKIKVQGRLPAKKRGKSAYMLFCAENRPFMVDSTTGAKLPLGEATKRLAALWRECDEKRKDKYREMANKENELGLVDSL